MHYLVGRTAGVIAACTIVTSVSANAPRRQTTVPFEAHKNEILITASVNGVPLRLLVDTAVDPSAIDHQVAATLHLSRASQEGAIEGVGSDTATAYESVIPSLAIGNRSYASISVLVSDFSKLRARFGIQLDGVLGYSLLKNHAVLIDYPANRITIYDGPVKRTPQQCRKVYAFPLRFQSKDEKLMLVPGLTIAGIEVPALLDTGSSGGLRIDETAPDIARVRRLLPKGEVGTSVGARGEEGLRKGVLRAPVRLGRFQLGKTDVAMVKTDNPDVPVNIGNAFLRALRIKLLVDIPGGRVGIYGDCR
ncbi:MAG TPA: pepsin/retropepsin-like aspartic protease family protein [Sphingomicrobium sp.]|nr:pepsin/retropepsin-like aspartic protease family protein [Sphingomicrobium sp.]